MQHPLSRFALSPSLVALHAAAGGRSRCCGAALARLPAQGARPLPAAWVMRSIVEN